MLQYRQNIGTLAQTVKPRLLLQVIVEASSCCKLLPFLVTIIILITFSYHIHFFLWCFRELDENVVSYLIQHYLSKLDDNVLDDISSETIHRICGAIDVNALEIHEDQTELLALLPTAFIMCHSCTPNTKHTFNNTRITVRAAVDIPRLVWSSTKYNVPTAVIIKIHLIVIEIEHISFFSLPV